MIKIIRESFKLTNKYIILLTPLILFLLVASTYIIFSSGGGKFGLSIAMVLLFLMFAAFLSGWFYMVKKAVIQSDTETPDKIIHEFTSGVGEYFLPVTGGILFAFGFITLCVVAASAFGLHFIGNPEITPEKYISAMSSINNMQALVVGLTTAQKAKLLNWNLLFFATVTLSYFIIMFYYPTIFFKDKNPFASFFISIWDLISKNFFKNIGLFIFVFTVWFILSIISAFSGKSLILHFIINLVILYFMTYVVVLVFNWYYKNYAQIGGTVDETV